MQPIIQTANATKLNLLEYYLDNEFHDATTLVIARTGDFDVDEYTRLVRELEEIGFAYPQTPNLDGYTVITMRRMAAQDIIRKHEKGSFPIYCYCGSTCLDENR